MDKTHDSDLDARHAPSSDLLAAPGAARTAELHPPARGEAPPSTFTAPPYGTHNTIADSPSQETSSSTDLVAIPPKQTAAARRGRMAEKHLAFIQGLDRKVRKGATKVVQASFLAADIDDDSPKPAEWSQREYRIARDARRPKREAPEYLVMAQKTFDTYQRRDMMAERQPAPILNVETIQVAVSNTYNYEVIEAEPEK